MPLAYIHELGGLSGERPGNELPGGRPGHGQGGGTLPVLPGIWPPPGQPNWPPVGGDHIENPIVIQGGENKPIDLPPGIYPPIPPGEVPTTKFAVVIKVLGSDKLHWAVIDPSLSKPVPLPPDTAQPK